MSLAVLDVDMNESGRLATERAAHAWVKDGEVIRVEQKADYPEKHGERTSSMDK